VYVNKFSHTRFEPNGPTKNPDVPLAKSIVDYIFRWLGVTFLPGFREAMQGKDVAAAPAAEAPCEPGPVAVKPAPPTGTSLTGTSPSAKKAANPTGTSTGKPATASNGAATLLERAGVAAKVDLNGAGISAGMSTRGEQFARFQTDAPSCDNCGMITVRNGNCYLCHNCGNSMGCS
jgi:ribonucleoside-diphosphate reductase alpha chain